MRQMDSLIKSSKLEFVLFPILLNAELIKQAAQLGIHFLRLFKSSVEINLLENLIKDFPLSDVESPRKKRRKHPAGIKPTSSLL